jgi:hypothetical protein
MSSGYIVTIDGKRYKEKNKDEVILLLMAHWNAGTGTAVAVEWPDKSYSGYEGFE